VEGGGGETRGVFVNNGIHSWKKSLERNEYLVEANRVD